MNTIHDNSENITNASLLASIRVVSRPKITVEKLGDFR